MLANLANRPSMPEHLNYLPTQKEWEILNQADFRCSECGFKSKSTDATPTGYLEVILWQKITSVFCALCATSKRLGRTVFGTHNHGRIIYSPNLTQSNASDLTRLCGYAKHLDWHDTQIQAAHYVYQRAMRYQTQSQDFPWVEKSGDVQDMVNVLRLSHDLSQEQKSHLFSGLRYLPNPDVFEPIIRFYFSINPDYFYLDTPTCSTPNLTS